VCVDTFTSNYEYLQNGSGVGSGVGPGVGGGRKSEASSKVGDKVGKILKANVKKGKY
jgi:hypothetical protein